MPPIKKGELKRTFFIAAAPPPQIQKAIEKLRHKGPNNWRWQHPEDYHISLAFPGVQTDEGLERIKKALSKLKFIPFNVSVKGLKSFNRSGHPQKPPHVLWAGLNASGDAHLRELHKRICKVLADEGLPHGRIDMEPHITIAKVPNEDIQQLLDIIREHDDLESEEWFCDEIVLYQTLAKSRPADQGHPDPYIELARFKLKP